MSIAVYHAGTNQVRTFIRHDHGGYRPPEGWELVPADKLPVGWAREPPAKADLDAQIQAIKQACADDILAKVPDWKQRNMTARAVELLEAKAAGAKWSPEEQAEADAIRAAWRWIKERRARSDVEERALRGEA